MGLRSVTTGAVLATVLAIFITSTGASADASSRLSWHVAALRTSRAPDFPGTRCPAFPADNVWNTAITKLPIDQHSNEWLAAMHAAGPNAVDLHPDFGPPPGQYYGLPWEIVPKDQPLVRVKFADAGQSDNVRYPFGSNTPIEGGPKAPANTDRHALMVDAKTCVLYELWNAFYHPNGKSTAGSGAVWSLSSNKLRPAGWTSADAAGLPILPGLVNYDEVISGHIDHAIRFTTDMTAPAYLWPARHEAGLGSSNDPPMGARFRLRATFSLPRSQCNSMCQTVITAMKTYGLILADNGSPWFFQGTYDRRWALPAASAMVEQLKRIPAKEFQAVNESCLMVSSGSGQALQPGTTAYRTACG